MYRQMRKKKLINIIIISSMALFFCTPALSIVKVSSNHFQVQDPPAPETTSSVEFTVDALMGVTGETTKIKGTGFTKSAQVNANSLYLECPDNSPIVTVQLFHEAITFKTNDQNVTTFDYVTITGVDQSALAGLDLANQEYWCTLKLQEVSGGAPGRLWVYPSAIRFDRIAPRVDGGRLVTYPIVALGGGQLKWSWSYNDPGHPGDNDGVNGSTCPYCGSDGFGCYKCNKSDTKYQMQVFRRKPPALYETGGYAQSTGGDGTYVIDTVTGVNQNRMTTLPNIYCYVWRVLDTAGNASVLSANLNTDIPTMAAEKCGIPDDKFPVFKSVEFYTAYDDATGFTSPFPRDPYGTQVLTSNACYYDPIDCSQGTQIAIAKIVVNEPLFDAQNRWGANVVAGDGYNNDGTWANRLSNIDEEPDGFDNSDSDGDGLIDEDVGVPSTSHSYFGNDDKRDNNANGYVDEIPNNPNPLLGLDGAAKGCPAKTYYNVAQDSCVYRPRIKINGSDPQANVTGPAHQDDSLTFICTQDGVTTKAACQGLNYGETVYRFNWDISGPQPPAQKPPGIEEDEYKIYLTGTDGVGNLTELQVPTAGSSVYIDNTGPTFSIRYYKNSDFNMTAPITDHDNNPSTPNMTISASGPVYIEITPNEQLGATPSMYVFLPDEKTPPTGAPYSGVPQPGIATSRTLTVYPTCSQNKNCNYCTGVGCNGYAPSTLPCALFRTCFTADETMNGYAAVTVTGKDRVFNQAWNLHDYEAWADRNDQDGLSDDKYDSDGIPNFATSTANPLEPDTVVTLGQFFAIDTYKPMNPAMSLPIAPCDGIIARAGTSCLNTAPTTTSPTLRWTTLNNGIDDDAALNGGLGNCVNEVGCGGSDVDGDGCTECLDEECIDGFDNDFDGLIDEDGKVCDYTGTGGWEVGQWRVQIATQPDFAAGTIVSDSVVFDSYKLTAQLPQRPLTSPYYWRVAPYDRAGNMGPYNPLSPFEHYGATSSYFMFGIDTIPPTPSVVYYSDSNCSVLMQKTPDGVPVTGDTNPHEPNNIVCLKITMDEPNGATPSLQTWQNGSLVENLTVTPWATGSTTMYKSLFEVDAEGSGKEYSSGEVQIYFNTRDVYGNVMTHGAPATGSVFIVDASMPEITCSTDPAQASLDNNNDGVPGQLDPKPAGDGVVVTCHVSKYVGAEIKVRVKQNGFVEAPPQGSPGNDDGLDNDCDGRIDEETSTASNNDGDGFIGEDIGASQKAGSGCYVRLPFKSGSRYDYIGTYNVVGTHYNGVAPYDGTATLTAGDLDSNSRYYLVDLVGNPMYTTATFLVDTIAPSPPTLLSPIHNSVVNDNTPQMAWRVTRPVPDDLANYRVEIATSSNFINIAAKKEIYDDGRSTTYSTSIQGVDIRFECGIPPAPCDHLTDAKYYWRVFAFDEVSNKSDSSLVYTFTVDTEPPGAPKFTGITTATKDPSTLLTVDTIPSEANTRVNIFINNNYIGTVYPNSSGHADVNFDYDGDGLIGEDPINNSDDDLDGEIDENPYGIYLAEGANIIEGQTIDGGGNEGVRGCSTSSPIYKADLKKCAIYRDSGPPQFYLSYYLNPELTQSLPVIDPATAKQAAPAGTIYFVATSTEILEVSGAPNPPTFTVDFQGTSDVGETAMMSRNGSKVAFVGSFQVYPESIPENMDGDAKIIVRGVDKQGNRTPADQLPIVGGYLSINTFPPTFRVTYWADEQMQIPLGNGRDRRPLTKEGSIYLRIEANESLKSAPKISITLPGNATGKITEASTTSINGSKTRFLYRYDAHKADGSTYIDGVATVTITGYDIVNNAALDVAPLSGGEFVIDTTPPEPPTLILNVTETTFTSVTANGNVKYKADSSCTSSCTYFNEPYAYVEIFTRIDIPQTAHGDGKDNDGDNRIDEEPNGLDGVDNDHDGFIDEDVIDEYCGAGKIWAVAVGVCVDVPDNDPIPNGSGLTNSTGGYSTITVSGIVPGVNYLYARATDEAGNTSEFSTPAVLIAKIGNIVTLTHKFEAGWNIVGIPLQPSTMDPAGALGLYDYDFYQVKGKALEFEFGVDAVEPGKAYWAYFPEAATATAHGITSTTNMVQLTAGWNMVSVPYNLSVKWDNNISVSSVAGTFALGSENAARYIEPDLYLYNGNTEPYGYIVKKLTDNYTIEPWTGFMVKTLQKCTLVFPSQYVVGAARK